MATRYVVDDTVVLTNTFNVGGTATDPTTITLEVTDPSGTPDTYTYGGGTITKTATGVYTKTITVDQRGTWTYRWTGTGTAADVEDGSFEVWPTATADLTHIVSLGEAYQAINNPAAEGHDDELRRWIGAVTERVDQECGPVVQRTIENELHNGGNRRIFLDMSPAASITTLTEYVSTTPTVLTVETNASKPAAGYLLETVGGVSWVWRRSSGTDGCFPAGRRNIDVTYVAGRYADTASVAPHFKMAVESILRRLWAREGSAWSRGGDPFDTGSQAFFDAFKQSMREWLQDEIRMPAVA